MIQRFEGKKRALARFDDGVSRTMTQEEILQQAAGYGAIHTDARPLSIEIDDGDTYKYIGRAVPGTATSDAGWQILRETKATGSSRYADAGNFSQIWDDRASLTYA